MFCQILIYFILIHVQTAIKVFRNAIESIQKSNILGKFFFYFLRHILKCYSEIVVYVIVVLQKIEEEDNDFKENIFS